MVIRGKNWGKILSVIFGILIIIFIAVPVSADESESPPPEDTGTTDTTPPDTPPGDQPTEPDKEQPDIPTTPLMTMDYSAGVQGISVPIPDNILSTGAATINIPIEVPPGRLGIAPNISLMYNSYQKNGPLGVGWSLDMGAIQRSTKRGVNYSANDFVFIMNGSNSELVPRSEWGSNYYGAKIEGEFSSSISIHQQMAGK